MTSEEREQALEQPEPCEDTISRQAAVEIVDRYNKSHMILKGKPMLGAASIVIELEELPSAQPEIIMCKDCKHKHIKDNVWTCPFGLPAGCDFYCGYGERKTE